MAGVVGLTGAGRYELRPYMLRRVGRVRARRRVGAQFIAPRMRKFDIIDEDISVIEKQP